ncbi:hypothetical protein DFH09DRAFT_1075277 [Mycena vulgaris]|nr:hypothetical protein DFH09DRAFT_1075277 [Mycena vulgaris]
MTVTPPSRTACGRDIDGGDGIDAPSCYLARDNGRSQSYLCQITPLSNGFHRRKRSRNMASNIIGPSFPGSKSSQWQNLLTFMSADVRRKPSSDNVLQRHLQRSSDHFHGGKKAWFVDFSVRNAGKRIYGAQRTTASYRDFTELSSSRDEHLFWPGLKPLTSLGRPGTNMSTSLFYTPPPDTQLSSERPSLIEYIYDRMERANLRRPSSGQHVHQCQTVDVDFCGKASTLAVQRATLDKGFYDYYFQSVLSNETLSTVVNVRSAAL